MDTYTAIALAEGFAQPAADEDADQALTDAWQHLIDTGMAWQLQGWFGRTAASLIDAGICHAPGGVQ